MSHPINELQVALMAAWLADADLTDALGGPHVFDAPPKGQKPPYVVTVRHDVLSRDGDAAVGYDHRLLVQCWHPHPSRKAVLAIADRLVAVALSADLNTASLAVTHAQHDRTDTAIDLESGMSRAVVALRFFTEPVN